MSFVRTCARAAGYSLAALTLGATALAQLHPPEKPGLRGAPFPSQNPPPDLILTGLPELLALLKEADGKM